MQVLFFNYSINDAPIFLVSLFENLDSTDKKFVQYVSNIFRHKNPNENYLKSRILLVIKI